MRTWTNKQEQLLRELYPTMPTPLLAKKMSKSQCAIKSKALVLGLKKVIHSNNPYTPEKKQLLFDLYPNMRNIDIAKILGVTESSVIAAGFRYKLRKTPEFLKACSSKGYYKKGQEPINKGRKQSEWMRPEMIERTKATRIPKGNEPHNSKYDGAISIRYDNQGRGYKWIRISKAKWKMLHVKMWEDEYGPVPKGHIVVFKDKDRNNIMPENLELITRSENMKRNTVHNYPKEIASTIQLMGVMTRQINKRIKQLQNG